MPNKSVPASIREVAFDCPHCGAYTTQTWFVLYATELFGDSRRPFIPDRDILDEIRSDPQMPADSKRHFLQSFEKLLSGLILLEKKKESKWPDWDVHNLHISKCFSCGEIALWVHDRLVFPAALGGPPPNPDLPDDVRFDYEEAGRILNLSSRSAAALLRLAIQKLCVVLGEKGKDLNGDIGSLVKKGLSPLVQKALDSVRVIGNEAVHPGTLDLKDDRDTATRLFELVNIIAEQMISNPKHVEELYAKLPEAKRSAIEKRDGKF
jgi:Domain of unknown function (DUF4145)